MLPRVVRKRSSYNHIIGHQAFIYRDALRVVEPTKRQYNPTPLIFGKKPSFLFAYCSKKAFLLDFLMKIPYGFSRLNRLLAGWLLI